MSHHHHNHNTTRTPPQRSYVVSIDAGAFANVEIVVGGCYRGGVWTPSRTATVTATNKSHGHVHVPIPSKSPAMRSPFSPLQSQPTPVSVSVSSVPASPTRSASDVRRKRTSYEREHVAEQRRMAEERAREQLQRRQREEARIAEARRAAAVEEEARRRHAERQEQQRRQQKRALREERRRLERGREIASAWRSYEARWGLLSQRQPELGLLSALTFERIPWPVADVLLLDRKTLVDALLRPDAIREFLLSPAHSPDVSPKDRIRAALRRWHPDKFARVLSQVMESDRDVVAEGMGIVVRCLNEMLERENHA